MENGILGFVVGLAVMGLIATYMGPFALSDNKEAKTKCEANLPRNQVCVLHYIPKENQ